MQTDKQSILPILINIFDEQKKGKKSSKQTKKITISEIGSVQFDLFLLLSTYHIVGGVEVETSVPAWQTIEDNYPMLQNGGRYQPPDCEARHRVALIVPFRDRDIHLKIFLNNIHSFLMRQQLDYGIFVIDLVSMHHIPDLLTVS